MGSYSTPILTGGGPAQQSIYEVVAGTVGRHAAGTRAVLEDGRAFYYSCNRSVAIDCGNLVMGSQVSVDFDDLATNTAALGDTVVNVTPVGTKTYAANELAGGYLSINTPGELNNGRTYRIERHAATTAATAFDLYLSDPIREEAFAAGTTATIVANPWSAVLIAAAGAAHFVAGATVIDIPAGSTTPQWFWAQTWGVCTVAADVAGDVLGHSIVSGTTQAGSYIGFVDAAADVPQIVGVNLFTSVDADFMPVFLQIAP